MSQPGKKIALVGTCPSSKMLAPYGDPSWEIWACSPDNAGGVLPRITRFFEIHGDLGFADAQPWEPSYIEWLNRMHAEGKFELVAQDHRLFPNATILPKPMLVQEFGNTFFTSTPAWMMALAMKQGAAVIGLYGLDMSSRHEYLLQRPGMHRFIELAEAGGIEIVAPMESDILQPLPLYGFELSTPFGRKLEVRRKELLGRIAEQDRLIAQATHDRTYLQGSLDDIDYMQSIWTADRDPGLPAAAPMEKDRKVVNLKEI